MTGWLRRLRARVRHRHFDRDVADELAFHKALKEEELSAAGTPRDDLVAAARAAMGSELRAREEARGVWFPPRLEAVVQDVRYAVRGMRRDKTFTLAAVAALALGMGATTSIFSVVNAALLKAPPYPQPERILSLTLPDGGSQDGQIFHYIRERSTVFEAIAARGGSAGWNLVAGRHAEYVRGLPVSAEFFRVLGVSPIAGRAFRAAEDVPGGPRAAMLSEALSRRLFASRSEAVGAVVLLGGVPHTVVGVMPGAFRTMPEADLWTPLQLSAQDNSWNYQVLGRLPAGAAAAAAAAELDRMRAGIHRDLQGHSERRVRWLRWLSYGTALGLDRAPALALLAGAVAFLLLIACVNVASLQLVRALARGREMATRVALGGGARRLAQQVVTESLVLGMSGGAAGLVAAWWCLRLLERVVPAGLLTGGRPQLDGRVLLVTLIVSTGAGLLFGLAPAMALTRMNVSASLREGARQTPGRATVWLRRMFNVVEVALAVVLLVAAGLMVRTFVAMRGTDLGFEPSNVVVGRMSLQGSPEQAREPAALFFERTLARLAAVPGVTAVAVGNNVPVEQGLNMPVEPPPGSLVGGVRAVDFRYVTPRYFDVFRIRVVAGRTFDERDGAGTPPVVIVNESFARTYFGAAPAIGRVVELVHGLGDSPRAVVGVVADVKALSGAGWTRGPNALAAGAPPSIYVPAAQVPEQVLRMVHRFLPISWAVRVQARPAAVIPRVQQVVAAAAPTLPFIGFQTMEQVIAGDLETHRFMTLLLAAFGAVAAALALTGLYGLVAYTVVQRRREVALRLALGATTRSIVGRFVREGLIVTAVGLAFGLGAAAGVAHVLRAFIFGVAPLDPVTFAGVGAGVLAVAAVASVIPARRAAAWDPASTLRAE